MKKILFGIVLGIILMSIWGCAAEEPRPIDSFLRPYRTTRVYVAGNESVFEQVLFCRYCFEENRAMSQFSNEEAYYAHAREYHGH